MSTGWRRLSNYFTRLLKIDVDYFVRSSVAVGGGQGVTALAWLAITIALTHLLSAQEYGQFQLLLSVLGILSPAALPGLRSVLITQSAKGLSRRYGEAVWLSIRTSAIGSVALLVGGCWWWISRDSQMGFALMLLAFVFPLYHSFSFWDSIYIGKEKFPRMYLYKSLQSIFIAAVTILVLFITNGRLLYVFGSYILSSVISNSLLHFRARRLVSNDAEPEDNWKRYGVFLTGVMFLSTVASYVDNLLVGYFLGLEEVAIYALGSRFGLYIKDAVKSFLGVLNPRIVKHNTVSVRIHGLLFLGSMLIAAIAILVLPFLMGMIYPSSYDSSIIIAQVIVAALPFFVLNTVLKNHLILRLADEAILVKETIITNSVKVVLMGLLLMLLGPIGLAIAIGLQYVVSTLVLYYFYIQARTSW